MRIKTVVSNENTEKVTLEVKVSCAVCRKGVGSNLCEFCRYWVHKHCSGIRAKLKKDTSLNVRYM